MDDVLKQILDKLTGLERDMKSVKSLLGGIEQRFEDMEQRIDRMASNITLNVGQIVEAAENRIIAANGRTNAKVRDLATRVEAIEVKLGMN